MKKLISLFAIGLQIFSTVALADYPTGAANTVLRVPSAGGRPTFGAVDLTQSVAVTGVLPAKNGGANGATLLDNCSLSASVGASALTVALKDAAGSDPSSTSPCRIAFRSSTLSTGTTTVRTVTAATSVVVSSGSTLGFASAVAHYVYVYAIDNAGTVELAVSQTAYPDTSTLSTTAEGGAGAADSNRVVYSTTARSGVAIRTIGRLTATEATAGTWATAPSEVFSGDAGKLASGIKIQAVYESNGGEAITAGVTNVPFSTRVVDTANAWNGSQFTTPIAGLVTFKGGFRTTGAGAPQIQLYVNGVAVATIADQASTSFHDFSFTYQAAAGVTVSIRLNTNLTLLSGAIDSWMAIIME